MISRARPGIMAIAVALVGCHERVGTGWDWNRMRVQPKAARYTGNSALPGGSVMLVPPAGTVPTDSSPSSTDTTLARGADRYAIFCASCHGQRADGAALIARNMDPPRPPSLVAAHAAALGDAALDSIMLRGVGTMMGFGSDLPAADRRAIARYLRQLQTADRP
ncbi:MAG: c-type cytochrome [Gemmatimonadales bacterium]